MDSKTIGVTIAKLRRQNGMTQSVLAEKLSVSNKAVSKWESGQGYPDITLFPKIAEIFGVSVDYLMLGEEKGITIAGTTLVDIVKNIDRYPEAGMLVNIHDINYAVGGCLPNTAINLAKIDRRIPISTIGKVGNDENGRYIVSTLQKYGINVSKMCYTSQNPTSFCDVMSVPSGERTFFHKKGANAEFCPEDIDIDSLNSNLLHIGYVLLLDKFDEEDKQYGTAMARFLSEVQKRGIKTSVDVVSSESDKFADKIIPVLKYCDYAIMNELCAYLNGDKSSISITSIDDSINGHLLVYAAEESRKTKTSVDVK
jgi:sugar/nucleoside kinase (ribokinase family)